MSFAELMSDDNDEMTMKVHPMFVQERTCSASENPLQFTYVYSYFMRPPGKFEPAEYAHYVQPIAAVNSVQQFWGVYNYIRRPTNFDEKIDIHFFKKGIKPVWEDKDNVKGGKWILRLKKGVADRIWENLLLAMIGEQFLVGEEICGAVCSIKSQEDIISLWNRTASDTGVTNRIRETMKRVLLLHPTTVLEYKRHDDCLKDQSSYRHTNVSRRLLNFRSKRLGVHFEFSLQSNIISVMVMKQSTGYFNTRLLSYGLILVLFAIAVHKPLPEGFTKHPLDRLTMHVIEPVLRLTYYWPSRAFFSTTSGMVWWTRLVLNNLSVFIGPLTDADSQLHMETAMWQGVKVRVYKPFNTTNDGAVIFIHGGGFALGSIEMYESLTRTIAKRLDSVLVSIDYRLSPETPFPGGLHDCEKVVEYFIDVVAPAYGVDPEKIVIMGDSAGGNLATVMVQRRQLRASGSNFAGQVLMYPLLQLADMQSLSYRYFTENLNGMALVDPESVALYYMFYAGINIDEQSHLVKDVLANAHISPHIRSEIEEVFSFSDMTSHNYSNSVQSARIQEKPNPLVQELLAPWLTNPDFSPIMRKNLTGLPPSFIMTCQFDVLRDEGLLYGKRLQDAGVDVFLKNYENGFHAMLNFHREVYEASAALDDIIHWTQRIFDRV